MLALSAAHAGVRNPEHMKECRELFAASFPMERLEDLLGKKLQLGVKDTSRDCVFDVYVETASDWPPAEVLLSIDFAPKKESGEIAEWSQKNVVHPRVDAQQLPGVICSSSDLI